MILTVFDEGITPIRFYIGYLGFDLYFAKFSYIYS